MERLISLFQEPENPWPSLAGPEEKPLASELKPEPRDPLYFVELMAYLRQRNSGESDGPAGVPREGAD